MARDQMQYMRDRMHDTLNQMQSMHNRAQGFRPPGGS
jgi:hypothetical protein